MSYFWGFEVEEFFNEEFPFENLNNMTFGNGLILLNREQDQKYSVIGIWPELLGE